MYNLCCISNELKEQDHAFQTMTWKRFNELCSQHSVSHALNELGSRWLNNVKVTRLAICTAGRTAGAIACQAIYFRTDTS